MTSPRVLVVGGGIGGLCLAHGLRGAGLDVVVAERTQARTDWLQGYRIHIDPQGSAALHACLAPAAWSRFVDAVSHQPGGLTVCTEQLRELVAFDVGGTDRDPALGHHGISRIALRAALLTGLDEVVRLGAELVGYAELPDGRVRAEFADGSSQVCDLLVGADGANSVVRGQLLPAATRIDIGVTAVAGKYRLTPESRSALPAPLTEGATMVLPAGRGFLFTAVWLGDARRLVPPEPGGTVDPTDDYTFWAFADAAARMPGPDTSDGPRLCAEVLDRMPGWADGLRTLVAGTDPSTVAALRIRSASPVRPWRSGPVTLLGDAIHSMTPMAGIGANTALRDAAALRDALVDVAAGRQALRPAVAAYERVMLDQGFAAVRRSLRNARMAASGRRWQRLGMRTALGAVGAVRGIRPTARVG